VNFIGGMKSFFIGPVKVINLGFGIGFGLGFDVFSQTTSVRVKMNTGTQVYRCIVY